MAAARKKPAAKVIELAAYVRGVEQSPAERKQRRAALIRSFKQKDNMEAPPVIRTADQVTSSYYLRRPTGIMQLDIDLGGGFPAGTINCLSGVDNSGKTTLMNLTCAMHQRIYGEDSMIMVAYSEGTPDYDYMRACGFMVALPQSLIQQRERDRKRRGLPPFTKEDVVEMRRQVGNVDFVVGQTAEATLGAIIEATKANIYGLIVLDSISALTPESELDKDFEDPARQAALATLQQRFGQAFVAHTQGYHGMNETTLVCSQQMRSNRQKANAAPHIQKFLPDYVVTGSQAFKHYKAIDVELTKGERDTEKKTVNKKTVTTALGRTVRYKLLKGKAGTHDGLTGEYEYSYNNKIDIFSTLLIEGQRWAMIERHGNQIICRQEASEEPLLVVENVEEFEQALLGDIDIELAIRREVLAAAGKHCTYR